MAERKVVSIGVVGKGTLALFTSIISATKLNQKEEFH